MSKVKRNIWHVLICVGLLCLIWGGYLFCIRREQRQISEIREDDFSWIAQIDSVEYDNEIVRVKGFAFELNKLAKERAFSIVLRNLDTEEMIFPKVRYFSREDVNGYFLCDYDYTNSGFEFSAKIDEFDLEKNNYEVLIKPYWEEYACHVGMYLSKGEVVSVNLNENSLLEENDTRITEIVNNGTLRAYQSEMGIYVYQCANTMYWIVKKDYPYFSSNGNMWMQFVLYTTQNDKLPMEQLEKKCMWNNCSFSFLEKEVFETDMFRVVKCEIPQTHSITRIETGHLGDGRLWWMTFRPQYDFMDVTNK